MPSFSSTGVSYLIRSDSGVYYWQAKIGGKSRRGSLKTKSKASAKAKLHSFIEAARERFKSDEIGRGDSLGDWVQRWLRDQLARPTIKAKTRKDYRIKCSALLKSGLMEKPFLELNKEDCLTWFGEECERVSTGTANARLRVFKAVCLYATKATGRGDNPAEELKRKPVIRKVRTVPKLETIKAIVEEIRKRRGPRAIQAAVMVEFAAYSGLRPGEMAALRAEDLQGDWLIVRGGKDGTKNYRERMVPINHSLLALIARERLGKTAGRIFKIESQAREMKAACETLGIESVTPYTLRHYFATSAIEAGIDVATVAEWMGHTDGGVLLLNTYTHVRRAHSLAEAQRLKFG